MTTTPSTLRRGAASFVGLAALATGITAVVGPAGPADAATKKTCTVSSTGIVSALGAVRGGLTQPVVRTDGATVTGTPGNDVIVVTGDKVRVDAGAGNDVVCVSGASPVVDGGDGDDLLVSDTVRTGSRLVGSAGADTIAPGPGGGAVRTGLESIVNVPAGTVRTDDDQPDTVIIPATLERSLSVRPDRPRTAANPGDTLSFVRLHKGVTFSRKVVDDRRSVNVPGPGRLSVQGGFTTILGSNHADDIVADGIRTVDARGGDDTVRAAEGDQQFNNIGRLINGGTGRDTITYAQAQVSGFLPDARIVRFDPPVDQGYRDSVLGFATYVLSRFDDGFIGSDRGETIVGGGGYDSLFGGGGKDRLLGGTGRDLLAGDAGDDYLDGGTSRDKCDGGPGKDRKIRC